VIGNAVNVPPALRHVDLDEAPGDFVPCCMGSATAGPGGCTCWEPVYDLEQQPLALDTEPTTRSKCCHDCAYRNGSPERIDEDERVDLEQLAHDPGKEFWCHQGARRVVAFRHPDGRVLPAGEGDYRPPQGPNTAGVECVWLADGRAGERCAGWAAHRQASERERTSE
jgi:hypothetical protein